MNSTDPFGPDDEMLPQTSSQSPLWANVLTVGLLTLWIGAKVVLFLYHHP